MKKEGSDLSAIDENLRREASKNVKKSKIKGFVKDSIFKTVAGFCIVATLGGFVVVKGTKEYSLSENGILKGDSVYYPVNDIKTIRSLQERLGFSIENELISVMQIPKSGITLNIQEDLFYEHKDEFKWLVGYLDDLFGFINPEVKFSLNISDVPSADRNSINIIKYNENSTSLGKATTNSVSEVKSILGIPYSIDKNAPMIATGYIEINDDWQYLFNNPALFRHVLLHEIGHFPLGMGHISLANGGGIMDESVNWSYMFSPTEVASIISYYGEKDRADEYADFLDWYKKKYEKYCEEFVLLFDGLAINYEVENMSPELREKLTSFDISTKEFVYSPEMKL